MGIAFRLDALVTQPPGDGWAQMGEVAFFGVPDAFLEAGWQTADNWGLPAFTTSRPWGNPGRRPAGLGEIVRPMKLRGGSWTSIVSPLTSIETPQA